MKSRIIRAEPLEELSLAYMKELRMHNCTRQTFETIDPYAEVYRFREDVYGIYTQNADGGGAPWCYLITGSERAMLIDTGFGIGNLRGLAEHLAGGKELIVVNTHSHMDHACGNVQFDEVYCHKYAIPYLEQICRPDIWDILFDSEGKNIWLEFDRKDIVPFHRYQISGCENHHIFSLGKGHDIELIFLGGHDAGESGYLDHKNRIFFCGDSFLSMYVIVNGPKAGMPFNENATLNVFTAQLEQLVQRLGEFDTLFPGHFIVDIRNTAVTHMLDACKRVLADPDCYDYREERKGREMYFKLVRGLGALAYRKEAIIENS